MRIESVDFYYLAMPEILDIGDGSQDLTLVRVQAGPYVGWGECEASPPPTTVTPMSHSACKPVIASVLGLPIDDVADIARITRLVRENSLALLQADHTLSGIDIALWDLLGKRLSAPVWHLLGDTAAQPKLPYASQLFGDTPAETLAKARATREAGYWAIKVGWGPYGRGTVAGDDEQVAAAREGIGPDGTLLLLGQPFTLQTSLRVRSFRDSATRRLRDSATRRLRDSAKNSNWSRLCADDLTDAVRSAQAFKSLSSGRVDEDADGSHCL